MPHTENHHVLERAEQCFYIQIDPLNLNIHIKINL